ncbi:unnamed protein product [Fraxinus pennsylvanica]|uniref:Uncharacterized protein n=1 Tax=Fraxinus pennsylvanica TaxID=56036 RepID=A0AAD1Z3U5_9LAMI|nr:unnamed protein product [Fraxinus pennsylvanica]
MPFNVWCGGRVHDSKGYMVQREKKQIQNYYSAKIWSFTMKSACCKHEIVIDTDLKNCEYVILSGTRQNFGTPRVPVDGGENFLSLFGVINIYIENAQKSSRINLLSSYNILCSLRERSKLTNPSYHPEQHEEDIKKNKEAQPVLCVFSEFLMQAFR